MLVKREKARCLAVERNGSAQEWFRFAFWLAHRAAAVGRRVVADSALLDE